MRTLRQTFRIRCQAMSSTSKHQDEDVESQRHHFIRVKNTKLTCNGPILSRRRYRDLQSPAIPPVKVLVANRHRPPAELLNIHSAFHQAQYQNVLDFDTTALSPENTSPARILKLRARIALGQTDDVLAEIKDEDEPDLAAVKALAQQTSGKDQEALKLAEDLAANYPENATVQVLVGTVLQAQGKSEEALSLLEKHQGNLDA